MRRMGRMLMMKRMDMRCGAVARRLAREDAGVALLSYVVAGVLVVAAVVAMILAYSNRVGRSVEIETHTVAGRLPAATGAADAAEASAAADVQEANSIHLIINGGEIDGGFYAGGSGGGLSSSDKGSGKVTDNNGSDADKRPSSNETQDDETLKTKIGGVFKFIGGMQELWKGGVLVATGVATCFTGPWGVALGAVMIVDGVAVFVHGEDQVFAGATEIKTGEDVQTVTSEMIQYGYGVDRKTADAWDDIAGMTLSAGAAGAAQKTEPVLQNMESVDVVVDSTKKRILEDVVSDFATSLMMKGLETATVEPEKIDDVVNKVESRVSGKGE